jgi:hypothetical protein
MEIFSASLCSETTVRGTPRELKICITVQQLCSSEISIIDKPHVCEKNFGICATFAEIRYTEIYRIRYRDLWHNRSARAPQNCQRRRIASRFLRTRSDFFLLGVCVSIVFSFAFRARVSFFVALAARMQNRKRDGRQARKRRVQCLGRTKAVSPVSHRNSYMYVQCRSSTTKSRRVFFASEMRLHNKLQDRQEWMSVNGVPFPKWCSAFVCTASRVMVIYCAPNLHNDDFHSFIIIIFVRYYS